ncbi:uncharacterized protein [Littorina saxatilis]|uniref:uncharacterized protein n=1 Tax=Littorina saxatilis TaxID=31220 RepID=UPI0038B6AB30
MDFAENFSCTYQEEIQAAHWHYDQVTIHPTVTYYKCPVCSDTTTESLVFISPDKKHDHYAVQAFTSKALTHLRETRRLDISHIVQWTDGCASQYKSKGPFADISLSLTNFNASLERNFFGSRHGKSPSDGESAVVKHHATSAVVSKRAIIANALDMYEYLQTSSLNKQPPAEGCSHFLRSFFWVAEEDIPRHCPEKQAKTVPGTRSFHSVRSTELNTIQSRHLTCVCMSCQNGVGNCSEEQVVGSWTFHNLQQQSRPQKNTKHSLPLLQQFPNPSISSSSVQLAPQSMEDEAPLPPPSPSDPPSPQPTPSVITLPAIHSVGDVINVQVIHHNDDALPPLEVDLVPSSSVETSPAISPVVSPISSADPGTSGLQPTVAPSCWSPHELPPCSAQPPSVFKGLLQSLQAVEDWSTLEIAAAEQEKQLTPVAVGHLQVRGLTVDNPSLDLYPSDGPAHLTPMAIYGDGNCLPRCGSVLAWGTEDRHLEMRARIALELIVHKSHYLGETGHPAIGDLPTFCAQYSDHFTGESLTTDAIGRIFETEVRDVLRPSTYMGMWQILALSSVLRRPIYSIYPEHGGYNVRQQLHQVCTPRLPPEDHTRPPYLPGIMWTHTQGKNCPALTWRPNHFVVCLPFCRILFI